MKEIIQKMREQAHEIAVKRRKEWWDSLSPAERKRQSRAIIEAEVGEAEDLENWKPGVVELDPMFPTTPYTLQLQLMNVDVFVPLADLAARTQEERDLASLWCSTVMFSASDNDVIVAPRPDWLPARDASGWEHGIGSEGRLADLVMADVESHGGEEQAKALFDEAFEHGPETAEEMSAAIEKSRAHLPKWARRLYQIADCILAIAPDEMAEDGRWLTDWLDNGAPMFDPTDTCVDRQNSEGSKDGNASDTEFRGSGDITIRAD